MDAIIFGLLLAFFAGLATTVGGLVVFFIKEPKDSYLAFSLAFSTGVMITVSFIELLPEGIKILGESQGLIIFFAGAAFAFAIDYFLPHSFIAEKVTKKQVFDSKLMKTGVFVAIGLAIHNFPEGFAVFASNLHSTGLGITLAIAIALHNIPEGIAIAIPVFFATKRKRKALSLAFFAGMAEPIGALLAMLILLPFLTPTVIAISLVFVAGIMVYICIDELLPACYCHCKSENSHLMTTGFLLGSIVMGATLVLLA
ncbi:MAG: zinc transporter ZupT [Candidatus Diapherotrites archaeon]